jgi:hypothetical protein
MITTDLRVLACVSWQSASCRRRFARNSYSEDVCSILLSAATALPGGFERFTGSYSGQHRLPRSLKFLLICS